MSKIPAINEIDANSPSQESTEVVVKATTVTPDINEIQETISASATIQEIDGTRKPTISEIYKIVNDGLFESTTNWWDYAYKVSQAQLNQDIISRLDNGVIGGGYSKGVDIITTTSNKVPNNTNVYSALKSDSLYPKKLNDEVINGIYDFLNGLTIGKPTAYTGGTWSVDQIGKTHLTTDYLYVRLKAIFETLQILNVDTIGGKLVISPAGSIRIAYVDRIKIDAPVFKHDENTDVWSISQVEDAEGNIVNETLNQEVYRCYFLGEQDGEEIDNKWKIGDQAQTKTFNVKKGTYHKVENSYLWRLVVNVSSDTVDIDGKKYHYVDLSQIDFDSGSDAPAPGDVLNQLGHRLNDTQRQTALVLNAVDNYAPSITLYAGVNYYTLLNKEYVEFGVYNGKAFFNVYGDMYIGDKGENPKTYIKYKNGKINIKANLEIGSSIGDKDLDQYIKDNGGVDEETVINLINNSQVIKDLQKQTDGAIETWFYEGVPTLNNLPAIDWTTNELKKIHIGDLYYDQTTGYAYRFTKYNDDVNPYRWNRIKDNDIVAALEAANHAQATADGKMKVFYGETKPTNYQVGDMWVNATLEGKFNNDIARAVAKNESFNADDWVLASRYSEAIATIQKWTNEYETKFSNLVDEVKQQKDQSIIVWYLEYEPTVDNAPANSWNTETLRSEHIGDIVYDIKNNHSYRWTGSTWVQIKDADFNEAMKAANDADKKAGAAGDLADSKRRIFYSDTTPTKPFDKGDLWIKQVGDKTETWLYNGANWVKSEDKDLADFSAAINNELAGIKGQLDGKAETWYQVDDPSISWTDKTSHEGDIWYNTTNGTTNYWNGSAWEQMDIPKDIFDTIDGKSSIFVDSYADAKAGIGVINKGYKERDLWILPEDATVNGIEYYKGDILTAVSNNTNFDETNWKKKVRYVGQTELTNAIDVVNDKINTINNITIPGINKNFNDFVKDGVLDSSEKARLTDLLNQASNKVAAVIDQVNNIITSKYLTNDNANKGKLEEANTVMNTAWTEYKNLINTLIDANTEITKVNIGEANTKYKNLQEKIKAVKQYLAICQADVLSGMGTDITSYKYLKDALNQTTEINGGLVLTSAIQLKDVDKKVTAGMNGIVKGDKTSIAAWYGGPMVDRDSFTSEELKTKVPGTDYAMSLLRHDGTGYLAGGNIHWNTDGVLSGNFNSFILQGTSMVTMFYYIRLFYLHTANQDTTDFNNIDYVTPMKTFSRLSVLPLGGIEGGNSLPTGLFIGDSTTGGSFQIGNVILRTKSGDPNILEIVSADSNKTANLGVQGGISAYGTYTSSTGGGGGLSGTIVPYSTAIASDPQNEGTKIASASSIYKLHSRISAIETNGATNISVSGSGNAITSVTKNGNSIAFTKGATFLTSHQSLSNYYTKSETDSKLNGYLSLSGGTMQANARITHGNGNLYIGNSDNDGWLAVQDICSQDSIGDDKWSIRVDGTASFQSIKFPSNRLIAQVSNGSNSPLKGIKLPDLQNNGIGIFSRVGNGVDEGGIILSEDTCVIYNSFDTGWGLSVRDKDLYQTDISSDDTVAFGIRQNYNLYSRGGFEKKDSSDDYVLLGGGGHKLESSLNVANADTIRLKTYIPENNCTPSDDGVGCYYSNKCTANTGDAFILAFNITNSIAQLAIDVDRTNKIAVRMRDSSNSWTSWASIITSDSIGSQSVNYASSAGNADTVDGVHVNQLCRIYTFNVHNSIIKVGTLTSGQYGHVCKLRFNSGIGYNAGNQDKTITVVIRASNGGANSSGFYFEAHSESYRGGAFTTFYLHQTSKTQCELYMAAFDYSGQSTYEVSFSNGDSWANEISVQNALPTSNIFTLPNYQIAYTDYNVASATKLQTPRTIWGQSFDGTGNVDGTLRIRQTTTNWCEGIRIQNGDNTWATIILGATSDYGTNANAWSIHRKDDNNFSIARNGSDGLNGLVMTSVGMGLGTTAPAYRLDVNGQIHSSFASNNGNPCIMVNPTNDTDWCYGIEVLATELTAGHRTGAYWAGKANTTNNAICMSYYHAGDGSEDNRLIWHTWGSGDKMMLTADGRVGIGANPSMKLHVNGDGIYLNSTATCGINMYSSHSESSISYKSNGGIRTVFGTYKNRTFLWNESIGEHVSILSSNGYFGIGTTTPAYKLHVAGDIYSSDTIRTAAQNQAIVLSNNYNPAWISALEGQVIFNTGNAIRFGETAWDWNQWAGLKYTHSNKTIYLGIADGSVFNANSAQSNGTLRLAGITTITPDSGARIGGSGGDLFLGNAYNSAWVKVQDMCSQQDSNNWRIYQAGSAIFNNLTINGESTFNGSVKVNNMLTAKAIMFTTADVNAYGTDLQNWDGSIAANVTNMFNGISYVNTVVEYSTDGGSSWKKYISTPKYLFDLVNDNVDAYDFYLGKNTTDTSSDANNLAQIKKNKLRVTVKVPDELYQELRWISVDVNNGVKIKCQVYFGNSSGTYTECVSKVMTGWAHKCDICISPSNVGNDTYRYVRLVFSHLDNHTDLRNGIVSKIRGLALTKYNKPGDRYNISTTGHIYDYDYNMNTYFPNSILAKGGVTAYQSSDVRLKTNIAKLNCLNVIKSIGGTYEFDYIRDHKHSIGFIAQNVNNPLLKDIVSKDDNGYLKINYWNPKLISLAFGALTEIDDEVDKLKARVRELENEVEYLKNKDYVLQ